VLDTLFDDAEAALAPNAGSTLSTFLGAATILLREGLEALLIVGGDGGIPAQGTEKRGDAYVHAGWIGALVAGLLTWGLATWVIRISGASRELTEGFGSVFAALVLLSVHLDAWKVAGRSVAALHPRETDDRAHRRSAWLRVWPRFHRVYREVFETILFHAALWSQGNGGAMVSGAASACVALAFIGWAMLRYSRALPLGKFFNYSSWLMAILTVVLAGKGIAALQEAGTIDIAPLAAVPRVSLIGLFPTVQTIAAQLLMIAALMIGFQWNRKRAARLPVRAALAGIAVDAAPRSDHQIMSAATANEMGRPATSAAPKKTLRSRARKIEGAI
jgi:high-affinity iron transporter